MYIPISNISYLSQLSIVQRGGDVSFPRVHDIRGGWKRCGAQDWDAPTGDPQVIFTAVDLLRGVFGWDLSTNSQLIKSANQK